MTDFVKRNREFWASFSPGSGGGKILIEEPSSIPIITHGSGVFSVILNQARSLIPVWLFSPHSDIEFLRSYVPNAEYVKQPTASWSTKLRVSLIAFQKFLRVYISRDILSFSYDGVKYGDIVYDTYLTQRQLATIRKINLGIFEIMYACIRRHEDIRLILSGDDFKAVMVSHTVGLGSGVMLRTALRYGYSGVLCGGTRRANLQLYRQPDDVYDYRFAPSPEDVDAVIAGLGPRFDTVFKLAFERRISGAGTFDRVYSYSSNNRLYQDRSSFNRDYGLKLGKKNVFVMLHSFNDNPQSLFRWMIFKDYYDWFIQTLRFARTSDKVNWVFKQHPAARFYPTKDVSLDALFENLPENIVYIGEKDKIDIRSLIHCADIVITCLGSAGFELPAMAGIPSVVAGDNFYTRLGFALEPRTREEYFEILSNAHNIDRLTPEQQKRAQAAYIYIHQLSRVNMSACPIRSLDDERGGKANTYYWKKVLHLYDTREEAIISELSHYIAEVAKPNLKRLTSFGDYQ